MSEFPSDTDALRSAPGASVGNRVEAIAAARYGVVPGAVDVDNMALPDARNGPRLRTVLHPEDGSEAEEPPYMRGEQTRASAGYTLSDRLWNYLLSYAEKHRAAGNGFGVVGPDSVSRLLSARYCKDVSEIFVKQEGRNPRRLTPRECARLMGFDEPGVERFLIPVSNTQAYRQFGNAVVVP